MKNLFQKPAAGTVVEILKDGPMVVRGEITVIEGENEQKKGSVTVFCRCGASAKKPYCDGRHREAGFKG